MKTFITLLKHRIETIGGEMKQYANEKHDLIRLQQTANNDHEYEDCIERAAKFAWIREKCAAELDSALVYR